MGELIILRNNTEMLMKMVDDDINKSKVVNIGHNKKDALILCQNKFIVECISYINEKIIDEINAGINYDKNFRKIIIISIKEDKIECEINLYFYEFSKKHFLENKTFIYQLRQKIKEILPLVWVNIFEGKEKDTYVFQFLLNNKI